MKDAVKLNIECTEEKLSATWRLPVLDNHPEIKLITKIRIAVCAHFLRIVTSPDPQLDDGGRDTAFKVLMSGLAITEGDYWLETWKYITDPENDETSPHLFKMMNEAIEKTRQYVNLHFSDPTDMASA